MESKKGQLAYAEDKIRYEGTPKWERREWLGVAKDLKKDIKQLNVRVKQIMKMKAALSSLKNELKWCQLFSFEEKAEDDEEKTDDISRSLLFLQHIEKVQRDDKERLQQAFENAQQMLEIVMSLATNIDIFIGVAAVADYRPAKFTDEKIKKSKENLDLKLIKNPDIISKVTELATKPFAVGFAAETNSLVESGRQKLEEKNLDLLFANNAVETFNNDNITVTAIDHSSERQLGPANKSVVARQMIELISYTLKEGLVE